MNTNLYSFQGKIPQTCSDIRAVNCYLCHTCLLIEEIANATTGSWIN
ncbi:hypothetical protein RINTHM_3430 [Richelia intracellularis HM01]|nr:hypothetical protein RINTHM_3430 [Richelia intracellularis HM01]